MSKKAAGGFGRYKQPPSLDKMLDALPRLQNEVLNTLRIEIDVELDRRGERAASDKGNVVLIARQSIEVHHKNAKVFYERVELDRIVYGIHLAAIGFSDHNLFDFLTEKPRELGGQLTQCVLAYEDAGLSLAVDSPQTIQNVQGHIIAIIKTLRTHDRSILRHVVVQRQDDLGSVARELFTNEGNLRRSRDATTEDQWIGDQLIALETTHNSRRAVAAIIADLEAEEETGALTPVKKGSLVLLKAWSVENENHFRVSVKRCKDRAKERLNKKM